MYGKNALVIDDSATARTVLKHQLNRFDIVVESASDGSHALELLKSHTPDVIFLDHIMPGLDGFQVLQRLKTNQFTQAIPVVMYTSQAAPEYTRQAKSLGAIAVISKKVTDEQLMEALDKAELYHLRAVSSELTAANDANEPLIRPQDKSETPHLSTVNREQIAATASQDSSSEAPRSANTTQSNSARRLRPIPVAKPRDRDVFATVDRPSAALGPETSVESRQVQVTPLPVTSQQLAAPLRGWLVALLLAVLVVAQGYEIMRDREQQQIISDLHERLLRQEQQLPHVQAQLASDQRNHIEATWRQVEFLMQILADHLQQE
jgi:CheY-like chemotaxis protein